MPVDMVHLRFNPESLWILNLILALVVFGVALDLRREDFRAVLRTPRGAIVGLLVQFLFFPAATFALTLVLDPAPSIALGMILVAACPGGNVSNFLAHLSRGNTVLSIGMSAVSTAVAVVMTPLNLAVWGMLNPKTAPLLRAVALDPLDIIVTALMLLGVPVVVGMLIAERRPLLAARMRRPFRVGSMLVFGAFVAVAFAANFDHFIHYVGFVAFAVALQNVGGLALGWFAARAVGVSVRDAKAVAIESGIQNSGFGLALIFTFFAGLGGMAIVAAWWGVWQLISGFSLAYYWSRRDAGEPETEIVSAEVAP